MTGAIMHDFLMRALAFVLALQSFLAAHPEISAPIIGALVTFLVKPRTPEAYEKIAKISPRLAAALQLFAALFPDPVKAAKVATKLLTGRNDGGKSNPPPPMLPVLALVLIAPMLTGCPSPASDPTAHESAVIVQLAHGVELADMACADIARAKKDADLARECDKARDAAKVSLEAAEDALDSRDEAAAGNARCSFASALDSARHLADLILDAGGKVPPALMRAFELAPMLRGGCE
jgi:hypothetical protein